MEGDGIVASLDLPYIIPHPPENGHLGSAVIFNDDKSNIIRIIHLHNRQTNHKPAPLPQRILQPLCDELAATLYAERNPLFLRQHYDPAFPILSILEDLGA